MLIHGPTDAERDAIAAHFAYLSTLHTNGSLTLAGRTTNSDARTLGAALLQACDESTAHALIAADPCVAQRVMSAELFPFRIAIPGIAAESRPIHPDS